MGSARRGAGGAPGDLVGPGGEEGVGPCWRVLWRRKWAGGRSGNAEGAGLGEGLGMGWGRGPVSQPWVYSARSVEMLPSNQWRGAERRRRELGRGAGEGNPAPRSLAVRWRWPLTLR